MNLSILSVGSVIPHCEENWLSEVPKSLKRRTPKVWQMSHLAVSRALGKCDKKPTAIVSAAALGALDETVNFFNKFAETGLGSPRHFIASVHNSTGGKLAVDFGIKGTNLSLCDSHTSLSSAIVSASLLKDEVILLVISEEHLDILDEIYEEIGVDIVAKDPKEGAIALLVTKEKIEGAVTISATAPNPVTLEGASEDDCFFRAAYSLLESIEEKRSGTIESYSETLEAMSTITVTA